MHFYPGTMTTHAICIRVRVCMWCVRKRAPARACVCEPMRVYVRVRVSANYVPLRWSTWVCVRMRMCVSVSVYVRVHARLPAHARHSVPACMAMLVSVCTWSSTRVCTCNWMLMCACLTIISKFSLRFSFENLLTCWLVEEFSVLLLFYYCMVHIIMTYRNTTSASVFVAPRLVLTRLFISYSGPSRFWGFVSSHKFIDAEKSLKRKSNQESSVVPRL